MLLTNPVSSSRKPARDRAGFVLSHEPDFHLSLTRFFTPAENQRFSPGDPEAPCVNSARRSDGAKYAIPSHFVLLTNPVSSSTQPQGIISNTPQKSVGCLRLCLRLCLRVAKIRTFAPLLVPLRCAGTIALLSDFCSAGSRRLFFFLRTSGFCVVARTGFSPFADAIFSPSRKLKIFARGPRSALRELRTQIRWRKIRYSVASLLTDPKSSGFAKESNCRMHS